MSQLIQIKDFIFLALKDGINITDETRKSFLSKTMQDFQGRELDVPTSLALISELEKCPFEKDDFVNGLVPYPETTQDENYVYINPMYSIGSDKIPELLKSAGMKLQRKKHIVGDL